MVVEQRGEDFAARLANAHVDAAAAAGLPVLQIGMDTPQVTADLIAECAQALLGSDAVLGMARRRRMVGARRDRPGHGRLPADGSDVASGHRGC